MEPRDTFITERLVLRRPALTDTLAVYEYASDSEVTRFMDWSTHQNARDALNFLRRCTASWEDGTEYTWAVTVKPKDHAVGLTIAAGPGIRYYWLLLAESHLTRRANFSYSTSHYYQNGVTNGLLDVRMVAFSIGRLLLLGVGGAIWAAARSDKPRARAGLMSVSLCANGASASTSRRATAAHAPNGMVSFSRTLAGTNTAL
jgi:hypothetical protein